MASNEDAMVTDYQVDPTDREVLTAFYGRLYPFKSIYTWLAQAHPSDGSAPRASRVNPLWTNREFAFTLQGDIYLRYNSFQDADEFRKQVLKLVPSRFEVGAVYNAKPRDKKTLGPTALQPVRRELVFDIDMTDYDSIRTCCSDKSICRRCWAFIAAAVGVLDETLRRDFGFRLLLWIYSGRRGIHCWVSDESAMNLTDEQRKAIMGWLEVIKGGKEMAKKVNVRLGGRSGEAGQLPPSLKASLGTLSTDHFIPLVLVDQDCFRTRQGWETLLELIPDRDIVGRLRYRWEAEDEIEGDEPRGRGEMTRSEQKWEDIRKEIKGTEKTSSRRALLSAAMEDIVLQYTYPRIDAEVSKHRNHLLKAPFCVHPSTGRVCIPVDPAKVGDFDPEKVPSVGQLLNELDTLGTKGAEDGVSPGWENTSLKPYVEMLDQHNVKILQATRERMSNTKGRDMNW